MRRDDDDRDEMDVEPALPNHWEQVAAGYQRELERVRNDLARHEGATRFLCQCGGTPEAAMKEIERLRAVLRSHPPLRADHDSPIGRWFVQANAALAAKPFDGAQGKEVGRG